MSNQDSENMMLTPSQINRLPFCKFSEFGRCDRKNPNDKYCVACQCELIVTSLQAENIGSAMLSTTVLIDVLKQAGVWPEKKA